MNNKLSHSLRLPNGFSIAETVVAIAVGTMALLVIVTFMIETNRFQQFISEQSTAITTADAATTIALTDCRSRAPMNAR